MSQKVFNPQTFIIGLPSKDVVEANVFETHYKGGREDFKEILFMVEMILIVKLTYIA